jgi:stage II sporulation protein D (peptidoglycan lytic transglycosylase)
MHAHPPILLCVLLAVATAVITVPGAAAPKPKRHEAPGRYRFTAAPGESLLVHGTYPRTSSGCAGPEEQSVLHERYRGTVEVIRSSDGDLYLVGELSFQDYLKGIAEVPRDWPMEALMAQVVAARTYALSTLDPGGEYDLCATDACQVYAGMGVEAGPWGNRWVRAVDATEDEVLLHRGRPATTVYFSTSNGRTYPNELVFGGVPLPYLRGIVERDDGASPLSRWTVQIPFGDLARFLAADGRWSGRPIRKIRQEDGRIVVRGSRRRSTVVLDRAGLRDAVNDVAACLEPSRYPALEEPGYRLPQAVPSTWFRSHQEGTTLVLEGRGWGHGAGMVQWGAYGKAKRGLSYERILAAYYGGLRPQHRDVPSTIRVLLATDLTTVTVVPSGAARVGGGRRAPSPPWRLTGGRKLRLHHGPAPAPILEPTGFEAARRADAGSLYRARIRLPVGSRVRLRFEDHGDVAAETPWKPFEEGMARIEAVAPPLAPGKYRVRAVATDGVDLVRTEPATVRVRGEPSPVPSASPSPSPATPRPVARPPEGSSASAPLTVVAVALGAAALLGTMLTLWRRRRLHRW